LYQQPFFAEVPRMKLDVKAAAITVGLLWGLLVMLPIGVANLIWSGYGQGFLDVMASLYTGYKATASVGQIMIGTGYGLVDGAIAGAFAAWVYNRFAKD
jgi:hypothetical protein